MHDVCFVSAVLSFRSSRCHAKSLHILSGEMMLSHVLAGRAKAFDRT